MLGCAAMRESSGARLAGGALGWSAAVVFALLGGLAPNASCAPTTSGAQAPPAAPPADDPSVPATNSGWAPGRPGLAAQRASAQATVGEALRALQVTGDACGLACPVLGALRLGVTNVCSITDTKDDLKACHEARVQLASTEARLKPACGTCSPRVDADASTETPDPVP